MAKMTPVERALLGWPRCPECGEWAVPRTAYAISLYAWACPGNPWDGPFTVKSGEQHEWFRRTERAGDPPEAEPFPGAPLVAVTPENFPDDDDHSD